jgi:transcriptional regulator with XRE-family HTH domain
MKKSIHSLEQEILRRLLRKSRIKAGLRQSDLARNLGRSQSFISKYESGELRLDVLELRSICKVFGISLSSFAKALEKELS